MKVIDSVPAVQLWLGAPHEVYPAVMSYLTAWWCPSVCGVCTVCTAISSYRHEAITWLKPERDTYLREQIDAALYTIRFAVDVGDRRVIVIQAAEALGASGANRLLKTLEEPHDGWFFILTAERADLILPTVRSRCQHIHRVEKITAVEEHPLMKCFLEPSVEKVAHFIKLWDQHPISCAETIIYIDYLSDRWRQRYMQQPHDRARSERVLTIIEDANQKLPMPGGHTLFWRLLLLKMIAAGAIKY